MQNIKKFIAAFVLATILCSNSFGFDRPDDRPNIIIVFSDDISARELPIYGSSVWSPPLRGNTSDPQYRAATPVLDQLAKEGCWIKTAWASVVCSPSRAMMMTGRYAHLHKWWGNKSKGKYIGENGKASTWPLYLSSPHQIGQIAQQAGYKTYWAGKTQMAGDLRRFGFDQSCFTPGNLADTDNPYTDFKLVVKKSDGNKELLNADTSQPVDTYQQHGWYWYPHVRLMNHDGKDFQWWPNTDESKARFGIGTYGPDVELDFIFDFMEKQVAEDKPFFVYHTTHLGHDAFDWLDLESKSSWPGTPVVKWDGQKYTRTKPRITGDEGDYDTHGTVTAPGMHSHVNYLDYQAWLYQNKLKELGIADNTIFIFCSDNGSGGYGKNSTDRQKGVHVPLIISAPGLTKRGAQDALVNMSDFLPTIAELIGAELPADYEINGESLVPFLFGGETQHREWLYGYKDKEQLIRGTKVLRDGRGKWWDVESTPDDLISFPEIEDWNAVTAEHRTERDKLLAVLPRFEQQEHGKNAPGSDFESEPKAVRPRARGGKEKVGKGNTKAHLLARDDSQNQSWTVTFNDDYEDRDEIGKQYSTARGHDDSWRVADGVLVGRQTKDDHGAVIRTELNFSDVDFQFDFRFNGGKSFNFVIDDANEKSVHSGHVCRASVFQKQLIIADDKTGAMNLEVRKQRQDKGLPKEKVAALEELLDHTRSTVKVDIKPNQWHSLRLRIRGDVMKAFLDDEQVTSLKSPGFAHPTKTKFGFTVNGQSIEFDNLVVRQLKADGGNESEPNTARPQEKSEPKAVRPRARGSRKKAGNENPDARPLTRHGSQPNILWVITDDHRVDSISAYNRATLGQEHSKLGYVSSPSADALARQGVLFTRAYCNSPGCAPSRTSMHFGMYPHHCGQYGFESSHQSADFCKPMFPKLMTELGYQTALFGKSGFSSFDWGEKKLLKTSPYQVSIDQKELYKHERVDWFHRKTWANKKASGDEAFWAMPDGGIYIQTPNDGPQAAEDIANKKRVTKELDLLYRLGDYDGLVIGGVSPQPTATTHDGNILAAFTDYVQHAGETYETPWGRKLEGPPIDKPVFVNLGFHFPHTPVLPSKEFRDQFAGQTYNIPDFSKDELKRLPPQLVQWFNKCNFADMKPEEKQQAIRDYYAFCAMGDSLVGKAVDEFKSLSKKQNREYVILYVVGDHGWHLGEQGGESKFAPYDTSNHCAVIAVSSDRKRYPAGTVCDSLVEFVDIATTCLNLGGADLSEDRLNHLDGHTLDDTLSGASSRDYVIGEMNHVIGPRAYLRCDEFAFSMRVREKNGKPGEKWGHPPGDGVRWALEAPREAVEMALFDLRVDPNEQTNVAAEKEYLALADWFRNKLARIILGDGRVESDWSSQNVYVVSDFAAGAHDRKLGIPQSIVPKVESKIRKTSADSYSPDSFSPDETVTMTAKGKHSVTYHVSFAKGYDANAPPRPLLVAFSPGGNGRGMLDKLREPANSAGWILVGCDKLRNGMKDKTSEIEMEDEVLEDIFKNIPHDPKRVYLGGFSGGAMRSYGITSRRTEPYAGVLAYGGWLGGPSFQDKPFRENMSIAMLTGTKDLGASGWVPIDTRTLKKRNCTVKHFAFPGGHTVAPAEVTGLAIEWLDRQWQTRRKEQANSKKRIALDVLYVGADDTRTKDFTSFLSKHFRSVSSTKPADLTLAKANRADVLVLDSVVRSLPDGYTKAMLMTGSSAALTGERYGSKIDWLCQCLDHEAYAVDTSHPVFQGPLSVTPTLVDKRCPHTKMKIKAWKVEEPQENPGLVSSRKHFAMAKDSEIISGGVNMKGINGVPLVREANRFLWGFVASPPEMTEEGQRAFVNALTWIHDFDGELQTEFAGLHTRDKIKSVLDSPYVDAKNLNRWFEQDLIDQTNADKEAICKYFDGKLDYVHVPTGSGLLQIDQEAAQLETPIYDPASIAKWIDMLDGDQAKLAFGLLQRYTRQRIRRKPQQWRQWYESNKKKLKFDEQRGYRFFVQEKEALSNAVKTALRNQADEKDLTEISPVMFEQGLAALHIVEGVAYQYAGRKVTLVIRARVKEGWHFYSTNNYNGTNIPTEFDIELPEGMEFAGPWNNPESSNGTLSDGVVFEREIQIGKNPIDAAEVNGSIRFQACTKQRCLSPQTVDFSLPIKVMAK